MRSRDAPLSWLSSWLGHRTLYDEVRLTFALNVTLQRELRFLRAISRNRPPKLLIRRASVPTWLPHGLTVPVSLTRVPFLTVWSETRSFTRTRTRTAVSLDIAPWHEDVASTVARYVALSEGLVSNE